MYNRQRNSGFIFNTNESTSAYNSKANKDSSNNKNYVKYVGPSSLNKTPNYYRKINNIYENNYAHKHMNTNSKSDIPKNIMNTADNSYRNTVSNKLGNYQTNNIPDKSYISSNNNIYYSNNNTSLNNVNSKNRTNKSHKKEVVTERSHNKDYNYKKIINTNLDNNLSLNDLIINKRNYNNTRDINNKSIDLQIMEFLNRNNGEKENMNKKNKYMNQQKSNVNKSMDSKRLLSKGNNEKNPKNNIIHLSNLNNYSYATDKYICYYENKRDTNIVKTNNNTNSNTNNNKNTNNNNNNSKIYNTNKTNNNNSKILNNSKLNNNSTITNNSRINNNRANTEKNILNKKEQNKNIIANANKNININTNINNNNNNVNSENPILFTKKYPKKENNKYPLRINYTNDNINNALESESILEFNEDKETDKDFSSKRDSKKVSNTYIYNNNSYNNNEDNNNNNKNRKYNNNNNNNENMNKIKHYYNTERVSTNDFYGNNPLNKNNERSDDDQNINNLYDNGEKNDLKDKNENLVSLEVKAEKREIKIGNNVPKKVNYTTNHNYLSFNPTKNEKKNNILKIKNNDQLMIINHNKNSSLGSNGITEDKKDRNYKISSNVVNEHILRDSFTDKELSSSEEENILRISMQSLNDSKIMEIANRYITDEENLDRNEINEILNSKKEKN